MARSGPLLVLPIASLTKIMTALLAVERSQPNDPVRITKAALHYSGSGVGLLPRGKRVRLETLLNGLLIVSGNDAAIALADAPGGDRAALRGADEPARRATGGSTARTSPPSHGLEDGNRSCARDLAVLTRLAMARAAHPPDRPPAPGGVPLPDQGRQAVPVRPQPADARWAIPGRSG